MKNKKMLAAVAMALAVVLLAGVLLIHQKNAAPVGQTYTGTAKGFAGPVTVELTIANDQITGCTAAGENETPEIGGAALQSMAQQIKATGSIGVDTVASATLTSKGVLEAAAAALTAAGLNPADYMTAQHTAAPGQDIEKDADVVVVGAGGAGMTAAITAAKEGKRVIILESMSMVGGNSVRATGGMNAGKTAFQDENEFDEAAGVEKQLAAAAKDYADNQTITQLAAAVQQQWDAYKANPTGYFDSVELFMLDTMIGGKGLNDAALVKVLAENSKDSIDWLASIGAPLNSVSSFGGASVKRIHRPVNEEGKTMPVGSFVIPVLQQNCTDLGVEILLETTAQSLLTDQSGTVIGVQAKAKDGALVTVHAKSVVLATGGFGANLDYVAQLKPSLKGFVTTNAAGAQGQGIEMAQAVGAATLDLDQIQIHPTVEQETSALITEGLRGDGAILLNREGKRFCDEVGTRDAVSAAELEQGEFVWLVVDQKMVDASSVIAGYIKKGFTTQGEDVDAMAQAMGVDSAVLAQTLDTWNASVAAGKDEAFGRTSFAQPLDTAPYYAIKVAPGVHHTMGGLRIDPNAQVLNQQGQPIQGLFAAGEVTGGVHGANRLGGNAVADFVVFGRIAGASAAANAQ